MEAVLDSRDKNGEIELLVKWTGYTNEHSTWEPANNLKPFITSYYSDPSHLGSPLPPPRIQYTLEASPGALYHFLSYGCEEEGRTILPNIFSLGNTSLVESRCKVMY